MRIALGLEYDGSRFHGFERQPDRQTVQGEVEEALGRIAASPVRVVCAGRTDAGVHAAGQVVHFDTGRAPPHPCLGARNEHVSSPGRRGALGKMRRRHVPCPVLGVAPPLPLRHREPEHAARPPRGKGGLGVPPPRRPAHAPRRAEPRRRARLLVVPRRGMPGTASGAPGAPDRGRPRRGEGPRHRRPCERVPSAHGAEHRGHADGGGSGGAGPRLGRVGARGAWTGGRRA